MHLINTETRRLEQFFHRDIPPYAILSHTWAADDEEVSFQDLQAGRTKRTTIGGQKISKSCKKAKDDGLKYVWIDTCCIDKTNSTELSEAINSMYEWYKNAARCYAFLSDVTVPLDRPRGNLGSYEADFIRSRWFTRGWTLQELLAPKTLLFYDRKWHRIGSKSDLSSLVERATRIPRPYLIGVLPLGRASVAQRMSWAAKRVTKRPEDIAYCLLGIFGVSMPMIYGEGQGAFVRLQEKIVHQTSDDTILAWGLDKTATAVYLTDEPVDQAASRMLATSPAEFAESGTVVPQNTLESSIQSFHEPGGMLRLSASVFSADGGKIFAMINCHLKDDVHSRVGIPLEIFTSGERDTYLRPAGKPAILVRGGFWTPELFSLPVRKQSLENQRLTRRMENCFLLEFGRETELKLVEVQPEESWMKDTSMILPSVQGSQDASLVAYARFRTKIRSQHDLLVILELFPLSGASARGHAMVMSTNTDIQADVLKGLDTNISGFGKLEATIGTTTYHIILTAEHHGAQTMFNVKINTTNYPSTVATTDWDVLLPEIGLLRSLFSALDDIKPISQGAQSTPYQQENAACQVARLNRRIDAIEQQIQALQEEKTRLLDEKKQYLDTDGQPLGILDRKTRDSLNLITETRRKLDILGFSSHGQQSRSGQGRDWSLALLNRFEPGLEINDIYQADDAARIDAMVKRAAATGHLGILACFTDEIKALELRVGGCDEKPVHIACINKQPAALEFLLLKGLGTNSRCEETSYQPIHWAACMGTVEVARVLLDYRADVNSRTSKDETPLGFAAYREDGFEMVKFLLDEGADVDPLDNELRTPLLYASLGGCTRTVALLLDGGADTEATSIKGMTPLLAAALRGHSDVVQKLLDHGADISAVDLNGNTALHLAIIHRQKAIAEALVAREANLDIMSHEGFTPLLCAEREGLTDLVAMMLSHGAQVGPPTSANLCREMEAD